MKTAEEIDAEIEAERAIRENVNTLPKVDDAATICWHTDQDPATVVEVKNAKWVVIQEDNYTRTDGRNMSDSQSYDYERNPDAERQNVRLHKDGRWYTKGGNRVVFGYRCRHFDYSF